MSNSYLDMGYKGKNSWWRYIAAIAVILSFWLLIGTMLYVPIILYVMFDGNPETAIDLETARVSGIDPLVDYLFLNLTIVCLFVGVFIAIKFIHGRSLKTLITPKSKINWRKVFIGFSVYGLLVLLTTIADYFAEPGAYSYSFNAAKFFIGLPIILLLTPIQTTAEELFFRGYILQNFSKIIKKPVILSAISAVIFTAPHLTNPEVFKSNEMGLLESFSGVAYYFIIGYLLAIITIKTNSLEVAMGVHAVNNLFGALVVGYSDSIFQTNTIFHTTRFEPVFNLVAIIITSVIFYYVTLWFVKDRNTAGESLEIVDGEHGKSDTDL